MKNSTEFESFGQTMRSLMKVPHSETKAALEAEKREKEKRENGRLRNLPLRTASGDKDWNGVSSFFQVSSA